MKLIDILRKSHHLRRRLLAAFVALILLGTVFVATTIGMKERRLTIAVRGGVEGIALKAIAQRFSHQHNVAIEIVELPYKELVEAEVRQLSAQHPNEADHPMFDLIMLDDPWLHELLTPPGEEKNASASDQQRKTLRLLKLDTADRHQQPGSSAAQLHLSNYFKPTLTVASLCSDHTSDCGKYYALPIVGNAQLFAYRPSQMQGTSIDKWNSLAAAVKSGNGTRYVARIGPDNSIVTDFMSILWANDPHSFEQDIYPSKSSPHVLLPTSTGAFKQFKEVVGNKHVGSASFDDFDVAAYIEENCNTVGVVWSAWALMMLEEGSGRAHAVPHRCGDKEDDLSFTKVPDDTPELGAWLLAIPYNAPQEDLARQFIAEMNQVMDSDPFPPDDRSPTDDDCTVIMALRLTPPVSESMLRSLLAHVEWNRCADSARSDERVQRERALLQAMQWSMRKARPRPRSSKWRDIERITGDQLQLVINTDEPNYDKIVCDTNEQILSVVKNARNPYELADQQQPQSWFDQWIADMRDRVSGFFS
jgi:spermidine/putrescine-binding protein